jgi:hypothetical protein
VKLLIEMDPEHYDEFLNWCSDIRPEYVILKNGVVVHRTIDNEDRRTIAILCDEIEAQKLLVTAEVLHLLAAQDIASALDPLREL